MIQIKIGDAVAFLPSLQSVMKTKLPAKAAYRLSRIASKLQPELTTFNEARLAAFKELGTPSEDGGSYEVKDEGKKKELAERLKALMDEEVKIDLEPVTLDMLGDAQLEPGDLLALEKVIA